MIYEHKNSLESLVSQGLVSKRKHPKHPLWVYNYTPKAVTVPWYEWGCTDGKHRNFLALPDARGLILDEDYNIIGRGFRKFWNYEQVKDRIPWDENCRVSRKWDGSLIITCWYKGELIVATRGSFESEQALWAQDYIRRIKVEGPPKGHSLLYEAIYNDNKIVVNYKREMLVELVCVNNETGLDHYREHWGHKASTEELEQLKAQNTPNEEGWVVTFYPSCFRVKIKFEDYIRLHRIRFQTTTHSIWEMLKESNSLARVYELVEGLPKDLADKILYYSRDLLAQAACINVWANQKHKQIQQKQKDLWPEKTLAEWIKKQDHPHILFSLWRGKDKEAKRLVWKTVEPKKEPLV